MDGFDLVQFGIGGVQRFITESTTTADVANSSAIVQGLGAAVARDVQARLDSPFRVVFPRPEASRVGGVTNKIVFTSPAGAGAELARAAQDGAEALWEDIVRECFGEVVATPGFPQLWWVSVTETGSDYGRAWARLSEASLARRRSRVFTPVVSEQGWVCAQSPSLPAVNAPKRGVRAHERRARLSAVGWVKRTRDRGSGRVAVRSTASIASGAFRIALLTDPPSGLAGQVAALREAVTRVSKPIAEAPLCAAPNELSALATELGSWVYTSEWDLAGLRREYGSHVTADMVAAGSAAAHAIAKSAAERGIAAPTPYYAVVMQDIDRLGRALGVLAGGEDGIGAHTRASEALVELGRAQRALIEAEPRHGVAVYTGGDDVLAFTSAASAIGLAARLRAVTREHLEASVLRGVNGQEVTASAAVVFAHRELPLYSVLARARAALHEAKTCRGVDGRDRDALAVVVLVRGGERAHTVQPWSNEPAALLARLGPGAGVVSAQLATRFETDAAQLSALAAEEKLSDFLDAEVARLVARHGGHSVDARALTRLARRERGTGPGDAGVAGFRPVDALLVARFLATECGVVA
ncbi:Cas10/Cmr2 second palm domain-containing protein [Nocardia lijiangensis]|uniref:Cas10/Cmr2 second palm domain-containing protein n=1 Tax=Nocardia lijiangensis TaxID=299618 RepID=UPI003D7190C0